MKNKNKRIHRKRHDFWFWFFRGGAYLLFKLKYNFKRKKYRINKNENVIILSNHQTDADGVLVSTCFNKGLHIVCTDSITTNGFVYKLLNFIARPIPIKKGSFDPRAIAEMFQVAKEGGNILLFPEGNRTYAEFQYDIGIGTVKLIKKIGIKLVLFNIAGGTGISPRWGNKHRKGFMQGSVVKVLTPEEYKDLSNEELYKIIQDNLKVYDSESDKLYKGKAKAEYLERMLFVCPKCGKVQCLESKGDILRCKECGLEVSYKENLHLESRDPEFKFDILNDWYNYQKQWIKSYEPKDDEIIFKDEYVELYTNNCNQKRKLVAKGNIALTKTELIFNNKTVYKISEITSASPISGTKFSFMAGASESYLVKGYDRFNPLKYVLMFNHLETPMKINKTDRFFNLD